LSQSVWEKLKAILQQDSPASNANQNLDERFCKILALIEFEADKFLASEGTSLKVLASQIRNSSLYSETYLREQDDRLGGNKDPCGFERFVGQVNSASEGCMDDIEVFSAIPKCVDTVALSWTNLTGTWIVRDDDQPSSVPKAGLRNISWMLNQLLEMVTRGMKGICDGEAVYQHSIYTLAPNKYVRLSLKGEYEYNRFSELGVQTGEYYGNLGLSYSGLLDSHTWMIYCYANVPEFDKEKPIQYLRFVRCFRYEYADVIWTKDTTQIYTGTAVEPLTFESLPRYHTSPSWTSVSTKQRCYDRANVDYT